MVNSEDDFTDIVFIITLILVVLVYSAYVIFNRDKLDLNQCSDHIGSFIFLSLMLAFLTPVLQSFAINYATDSTIFITVLLICIHLISYDYQYVNKITSKDNDFVGSPTSLNAIFMASILLASRI